MPTSRFLTKLAADKCKENHFPVVLFSEISYRLFLSLSCSVSKITPLQVFHSFCLFFKHVRGVSKTQSNTKIEAFVKIVHSSRGVFRTELNI